MSDRMIQSVSETNKRSGQTVQSYQSAWMAHWMVTSSSAETRKHSASENDNLSNGLEVSRSVKALRAIEPKKSSSIMSSRSSGNVIGQGSDNDIRALRPIFGNRLEFGKGKAPADLIREREMENGNSRSDTSMNFACFRGSSSKTSLLFDDAPSTSDRQLQKFGRDWFPNSKKLPNCVHDLETMRICTTVDSVEEMLPSGFPRFSSQTTHSLLITKKSDVNLSNVYTKRNKNKSTTGLHRLLPFFGRGKRGVKLESLSSSFDGEGERKIGDVEVSKVVLGNESSAETNTMDMDIFKGKKKMNSGVPLFSGEGANSSPPTKEVNIESNLPSRTRPPLKYISSELPALPAVASSSENICPSSSKTQSLDMDMILTHAEKPHVPKSNFNLNNHPDEDPSNRWIKRLKLNSSFQGTKSSNLSENPSHEKTSNFLGRIHSSEQTSSKHLGKEPIISDKIVVVDSNVGPTKKGKDLLLSDAWINRLLSKKMGDTQKKKVETAVICEPQSSKLALEDLQKKQFPSIAAMAMMGKTMSGFQSCEIQKRDTFTVWNTKAF